jgi:hypothetical protein
MDARIEEAHVEANEILQEVTKKLTGESYDETFRRIRSMRYDDEAPYEGFVIDHMYQVICENLDTKEYVNIYTYTLLEDEYANSDNR